jgi:hypothetical protein
VVVAAALAAILLCIAGVLIWHRDSAVMRAAVLPLQLFLLLCLLSLCVGAALYTLPPAEPSADSVCFARAWLTLLPLCGMLAALFARAAHVTAVFRTHGLRSQKRAGFLLRWLVAAACVQLVLLIPFTVLPLTRARLAEQRSLPGQLILECGGREGFWPWMAVQMAFLLLLLIRATRVAFRARRLPIFFNEAVSFTFQSGSQASDAARVGVAFVLSIGREPDLLCSLLYCMFVSLPPLGRRVSSTVWS